MAQEAVITDTVLMGVLVVLGMVIVYLIIREIRIMKTANRTTELELEKDKLKLLQQHEASKMFSVYPALIRADRGDQAGRR